MIAGLSPGEIIVAHPGRIADGTVVEPVAVGRKRWAEIVWVRPEPGGVKFARSPLPLHLAALARISTGRQDPRPHPAIGSRPTRRTCDNTDRTGQRGSVRDPKKPDRRPLELAARARAMRGVSRMSAITHELVGAETMWVGITILEPGTTTEPHHHGDHETGVYVLAGRIRLRWGARLESEAELEAGDLAFVPPNLPHREVNPSPDEPAVWLVMWNASRVHVPLVAAADGTYGPGATRSV